MEIVAADVTLVMKFMKRKERASRAKPGLGTSVHPLQALYEKFNIPNSPAINFHVDRLVPFGCDLATALFVDLLAGDQCGLDSSKVDLLAINLRLYAADELARELHVAGGIAH